MKKIRKQKHPKLPNGYGSIRWLGNGRRNPYAVHPPGHVKRNGVTKVPPAICYVDNWYKGFAVLTAYHAGTYVAGMERDLSGIDKSNADDVIRRILADYNVAQGTAVPDECQPTFAEIYERFFSWKFLDDKSRTYSKSTIDSAKTAFKNCAPLHEKIFCEIKYEDLQAVVDACPLKHASKEIIVSLIKQMYSYAEIYDLTDKNCSRHLTIKTKDDDEHGIPFSDADLKILWQNSYDPVCEFLIIMCYSGFRISEYKTLEVNLKEKYFKGGMKTAAGKNRIVPIHSAIFPLVKRRMERDGEMLGVVPAIFREKMYKTLENLSIEKHTPHDCRHTFSALCEKFKVNENDRKRMLGHSFGQDITNRIYGHRNLEDLRTEIEKILVTNL